MLRTIVRSSLVLIASLSALVCSSAANAMFTSSVMNYQAYVTPKYDNYGNKVGIIVHYSIGALRDTGGAAHYSAVCVNQGNTYAPCVEQSAKAWSRDNWSPAGYWVSQTIGMLCDGTLRKVQIHQPYISQGSYVNFHVWNSSPYRLNNGYQQLFYSGSSDSITIPVQYCQ